MPLIIFILLIPVALGLFFWWQHRAEGRLMQGSLSEEARAVIAAEVPITRRLPPELQPGFEGRINRFLHQVEFVGCNGLEVTEAMRLSIAAQACLLIVNSPAWYRNLRTVLIYPSAFRSRFQSHEGYVVQEEEVVRLGESWQHGPVVLSWQHSQHGAADADDGRNVVLHEFAHQLDGLTGAADGVPLFRPGQTYERWEQVVLDAFDRHVAQVARGRRTVLDHYGATNHEEFFAVAVEAFFEKPRKLKQDEPELYGQLAVLLDLDPENW